MSAEQKEKSADGKCSWRKWLIIGIVVLAVVAIIGYMGTETETGFGPRSNEARKDLDKFLVRPEIFKFFSKKTGQTASEWAAGVHDSINKECEAIVDDENVNSEEEADIKCGALVSVRIKEMEEEYKRGTENVNVLVIKIE